MKEKPETSHVIELFGDNLTNTYTVGVVAIDNKKQKYLRIILPTQTLVQHLNDRSGQRLTRWEQETPEAWWLTKCDQSEGDRLNIIKVCMHASSKPPFPEVIDLGRTSVYFAEGSASVRTIAKERANGHNSHLC